MKRILTGDRTTGKLHIGHYVGSLQSRVALQDSYEEFILIADVQALTTHFSHPEMINESIYNVCMDNIAAGLDPEKVTFVQQSMVPSIAELTMFYSMLTTVNHLLINPTIKTEARSYGMGEDEGEFSYDFSKLSYGFLGYPVSQSADITFCNADLVPVGEDQLPHMEFTGEDQLPHMEFTRRLVRHFNEMYGTEITVPQTKLSMTPRLAGLDGNAKMGKSLGNAIYLSDTPDEVWDKVRNAVTDTNRITVKTPGNPDICPTLRTRSGTRCATPSPTPTASRSRRLATRMCVRCTSTIRRSTPERPRTSPPCAAAHRSGASPARS